MAGTSWPETLECTSFPTIPIRYHWEIQYSRFFNYPCISSTSPVLRPLPTTKRIRTHGTWVSSPTASLQLLSHHSSAELVLVVSLQEKIHEEHFISKLHFSWPQVSCVNECPVRGSRVIFASYSDCVGQIQKFAMRFSAASESQSFMDSVKATMKPERNSSELGKSSQFEFICSNGVQYRDAEDNKPPLSCEGMQYAYSKDHDLEGNCATLPPSFTTLLAGACIVPKKETPEGVLPDAQHVRYMTGSSFNDMLTRLEMVISEMGGDLAL
ncbi:hypothetical protein AAG906_000714 [Vitis piasezkii]